MVEVKVSIFNLIDFKCSSSENALIEKKITFSEKYKNNLFSATQSKANMHNCDVTISVMNHYLLSRCILRICCYEVIDRVAMVCAACVKNRCHGSCQLFKCLISLRAELFLTFLV